MDKQDFLFEIGCAELPASMLASLSVQLGNAITAQFNTAQLSYQDPQIFASPRRLAIFVPNLLIKQPPRKIERLGPNVADAYDKNGTPTLAGMGFMRSCGVSLDEIQIKDTPKGKRLCCTIEQPGLNTRELLPSLISNALQQINIPKSMRWGSSDISFIRPVYWIVMIYGNDIINAEILGKKAGRETQGHRFLCSKALTINSPKDYSMQLYSRGYVMADFKTRKEYIRKKVREMGNQHHPVIREALLDEVTSLVEWPVILKGQFKKEFLSVPKEALISAMETHQKCFPVETSKGVLEPSFILVSNIESKDPEAVIRGNERVINARLSDAAFFYHQDLKHTLESRLVRLQGVIFQQLLGSIHDKSQRVSQLAHHIAKLLNTEPEVAKRAGLLCKCDLVSEMVYEFPNLQGIMGYYYALQDKESESCAVAIKEHYYPRFSGDQLPTTVIGSTVALADRLDTLIGILGVNLMPASDSDPFALRRAAQGIFRIMIEKKLPLDLKELLTRALEFFTIKLPNQDVVNQAYEFILNRMKAWYIEQGIAVEVFEAVAARNPTSPLDFHHRLEAVQQFQTLPEASALAAANKRVNNILKKTGGIKIPEKTNAELFEYDAEIKLAELLETQSKSVAALYQNTEYTKALTGLASLKEPIDHFFDKVMVMVENEKIRDNRLALLKQLHQLMTQVADISLLP